MRNKSFEKQLLALSDEELHKLHFEYLKRDQLNVAYLISKMIEYRFKTVKVFKGRKVPIGTVGVVFWLNYYPRNTWFGTTKVGIKDDNGNVYFTDINNVEIIR